MKMSNLFRKDRQVILYLHGGAMVLCSHKTHRELLLRLAGKTGMIILAIHYRRPPEYPWPTPVDDCFNVYKMLVTLHNRSESSTLPFLSNTNTDKAVLFSPLKAEVDDTHALSVCTFQ